MLLISYRKMDKGNSEQRQLIESCRDMTQDFYKPKSDNVNHNKLLTKWEKALIKLNKVKEYLERKIFALIVICLAASILYYSNFVNILIHNVKVSTLQLILSLIGFLAFFGTVVYLSVYLTSKGLNENQIDEIQERITPYLTLLGLISTLFLISAIWDVFGYYSIFLVLILEFGFVMTFRFAPSGLLGNLMFYAVLVVMIMSGHYIDHDGYFHH